MTGQTIALDGQSYTVAGVLPVSFVFPMDVKVDVMATLPVSPTASHHDLSMSIWAVYGRLKPGVTISQARADAQRLFARSKADIPLMFRSDTTLDFEPLQMHRVGKSRKILSVLLAAVACLLLITCANVSNLLLGRWSARSGELAVRTAIGAGSARLMRQLFTEAALLTVAGSALGLALASAMLYGFVHFAAGELPRLTEVTMDLRVFLIALLICILTTVALGALPAITASKIDIRQGLRYATNAGNRNSRSTGRRSAASICRHPQRRSGSSSVGSAGRLDRSARLHQLSCNDVVRSERNRSDHFPGCHARFDRNSHVRRLYPGSPRRHHRSRDRLTALINESALEETLASQAVSN